MVIKMKKKILIVDDDMDILTSMSAVLKSEGHDIAIAVSSDECREKYSSFKPDIIFLDLIMDRADTGLTLCKEIRKTDQHAKIYLLSAVGDETARTIDIHEAGFNGAMSKPVTPDELINLVK